MKTAQTIAANAEIQSEKKPKRKMHPRSLANLVAPWTKENRPKSPGRPKDTAADISRKAFENNQEEIYKAITAKLLAGDAYAYSVHSERAYGKLTQPYEDKTDRRTVGDLNERIAAILGELGIAAQIDASGGVGDAGSGEEKADFAAEDTVLLPGNGAAKA